jgi:hypothetical protein
MHSRCLIVRSRFEVFHACRRQARDGVHEYSLRKLQRRGNYRAHLCILSTRYRRVAVTRQHPAICWQYVKARCGTQHDVDVVAANAWLDVVWTLTVRGRQEAIFDDNAGSIHIERWVMAESCAGTAAIGHPILPVGYGGTSSTAEERDGEEAVDSHDSVCGWERKQLLRFDG